MEKKFKRTIENFKCLQCGVFIKGNGYTNHCPKCLWSRHVDVNPGDRRSLCLGMMEPVEVEKNKEEFVLIHLCVKCGEKKKNKVLSNDDFDVLVNIASKRK